MRQRNICDAVWESYEIPGGDRPVDLVRLGRDVRRGFDVLVRFPAGWTRSGPGHYDAAEEVIFLAGSFEMNGHTHVAGDYAWFPADHTRTASVSATGALALAWFSKPNRWTEAVSPVATDAEGDVVHTRWPEVAGTSAPLGVHGWPLRVTANRGTWVLDAVPEGATGASDYESVDLFDLAGHRWWSLRPGDDLPVIEPGPVWARVVRDRSSERGPN